jgi:glucose-6-phosphate 1-epimerase
MQNLSELNKQFALAGRVEFVAGVGAMPQILVNTEQAQASIALYGGQVLSYQPAGMDELLYLSEQAIFEQGKAIRGGIPVCWPWFGDDPMKIGRQAHGFARNLYWDVLSVVESEHGVQIVLGLHSNATTQQWWQAEFDLKQTITVGASLDIKLITKNTGNSMLTLSEALHSYFKVSDVSQVSVEGLDQIDYLDKTTGFSQQTQHGDIKIEQETDWVFLSGISPLTVVDPALNRKITIQHQGANNAVVWNPWDKAAQLKDMPDADYQAFLCVETANALAESVSLAAGESHTMSVCYQITSL